ncbi:hypothetical protein HMPREF0023_0589 [Acinetobacter sp. ATCC 27244]|nr:hypothetical protein HMPREF0023_0589 [Acinetobacter sp. ATCC 27244]
MRFISGKGLNFYQRHQHAFNLNQKVKNLHWMKNIQVIVIFALKLMVSWKHKYTA